MRSRGASTYCRLDQMPMLLYYSHLEGRDGENWLLGHLGVTKIEKNGSKWWETACSAHSLRMSLSITKDSSRATFLFFLFSSCFVFGLFWCCGFLLALFSFFVSALQGSSYPYTLLGCKISHWSVVLSPLICLLTKC